MAPSIAIDAKVHPTMGGIAPEKAPLVSTQDVPPSPEQEPTLPELDASLLTYSYTKSPKPVPEFSSAEHWAQRTATDHTSGIYYLPYRLTNQVITATWTSTTGWTAPALQPYHEVSLSPTASCLQYATTCFEGLKLYRGHDGQLRLFRADLNCARLARSADRIALPVPPEDQVYRLISTLCRIEAPRWLPKSEKGKFIYIRPTFIATDPSLGVQKPNEALLMVFLTCMPPFYDNAEGLRLLASESTTVRAWPGGFGYAKVGANYGPTLRAQGEAKKRGFSQVLWLLPNEGGRLDVTEAGASNFFVVWRTKEGKTELVTAPLKDGLILEGVTRASLLQLARERLQDVEVVERIYDMKEIVNAVEEGRLLECFTAGTAYFVSEVAEVEFQGKKLFVKREGETVARQLKSWLEGIMYGTEEHAWGQVVKEE